jgi:hypothetical protein
MNCTVIGFTVIEEITVNELLQMWNYSKWFTVNFFFNEVRAH